MSDTARPAPVWVPPTSGRALVITVAGLMLTLFLSALDGTIISTAMPRIVADLGGLDRYSWVTTAYLLASTAMIPIISKLSDIYGRKQQLIISICGFVAGSALCGFAQTMDQLVLFRFIQGVAGGGLFTLVFSAVADIFPPAERGKYQGLFFGMVTSATIAGPLIGGFITEHFSWRWVFYVNLPLCVLVLAVLIFGFPGRRGPVTGGWKRIDFPGAALVMTATSAFLLAVVSGESDFNWFQPVTGALLAVAILAFAAFLWVERRVSEPIIPLELFGDKIVLIGTLAMFCNSTLMVSQSLYSPLYIQTVLGQSPSASGLFMLPQILVALVTNITAGQVMSRIGRYRPVAIVGCLALPTALAVMVFIAPLANPVAYIVAGMLYGLGFSTMNPSLNLAVQNALPSDRMGVGTGMTNLVRSLGQAIGAALIGSIAIGTYRLTLPDRLPAAAATLPPEVLKQLTEAQSLANHNLTPPAGVDPEVARSVVAAAISAMATGIQYAWAAMFVVVLCAAALIIFRLPDVKLRRTPNRHSAPPPIEPTPATPAAAGARG